MASQLEETWKVRQNEIEAYRFQGLEHYARAMMREKLEKSQRRREKKRAKQRQPWKNSHHLIEIITCSVLSFQLPFIQTFCLSYFPTLQLACEECFVHFDFEMCFAPQRRVCICLSLIWPAGSAPAALASLLFDPPEPQIIAKTQCFATFLPFRAPVSSFFWDFIFPESVWAQGSSNSGGL